MKIIVFEQNVMLLRDQVTYILAGPGNGKPGLYEDDHGKDSCVYFVKGKKAMEGF